MQSPFGPGFAKYKFYNFAYTPYFYLKEKLKRKLHLHSLLLCTAFAWHTHGLCEVSHRPKDERKTSGQKLREGRKAKCAA